MYCKYLIVSLLSCKNCLLFAQTFELSSSWDIYEIVNRGIKECRGDSFGGRDGGMMLCDEMEKKSAKYDIGTLFKEKYYMFFSTKYDIATLFKENTTCFFI